MGMAVGPSGGQNANINVTPLIDVLLVLLIGLIEAGRLIWTQTTLDRAVEAAARCAAVDTVQCGTASAVQKTASSQPILT